MKRKLAASLLMIALAPCMPVMGAQLYDFESGTDGFAPNGGFFPVSQDTIGATTGSGSLKVEVPELATFVGVLTSNVPSAFNNPPGVQSIVFDVTITEEFTTGFAGFGFTLFGATQPGPNQAFGVPVQFSDFVNIDGLAPGTYTLSLEPDNAAQFRPGESFNDIVGSDVDDLIPSGFQFFINKSGTAPLTAYIDNVRVVVPEPTSVALLLALGCGAVCRRR